jgi:hypothetical protein
MKGTCLNGKRNGGYRSHATKRRNLGENANSQLKMGRRKHCELVKLLQKTELLDAMRSKPKSADDAYHVL